MTYYIEVIGAIDQCAVGPFTTKETAEAYRDKIKKGFDTTVMTDDELRESFAKYGELHINEPLEDDEVIT